MKILLAFTLLSANCYAQVEIGISTGLQLFNYVRSPRVTTLSNNITFWAWQNSLDGGFWFGLYVMHKATKMQKLKHELSFYQTMYSYEYQVPVTLPGSNFKYFYPVSGPFLNTLNYRLVTHIYRKRNFVIRAGPAVGFNFLSSPIAEPYFSEDYPEAAELAKTLDNSFNRVVLYADFETGWKIKRFDLTISANYSLSPLTGRFNYDGYTYRLQDRGLNLFLRLGWRFYNPNNTSQ